jgi:hypothetical protein
MISSNHLVPITSLLFAVITIAWRAKLGVWANSQQPAPWGRSDQGKTTGKAPFNWLPENAIPGEA